MTATYRSSTVHKDFFFPRQHPPKRGSPPLSRPRRRVVRDQSVGVLRLDEARGRGAPRQGRGRTVARPAWPRGTTTPTLLGTTQISSLGPYDMLHSTAVQTYKQILKLKKNNLLVITYLHVHRSSYSKLRYSELVYTTYHSRISTHLTPPSGFSTHQRRR